MIHVDASAVPGSFSGVRTRLRGLYAAYGALSDAPPVTLVTARNSELFDGVDLGAVRRVEVPAPGGPWRRALRRRDGHGLDGLGLWHAETLPPLAPRGVPSLITLHDLRFLHRAAEVGDRTLAHRWRALAYRRWVPRVLRDVRAVVTVSRATRDELVRRLGLDGARVHVIPNVVNPGAPAATPAPVGIPEPYFLVVGHLRRRKGLSILPAALQRIGAPVSLVLVGDGPQRGELAHLARTHGVADRVRFLGRQPEAVVERLRHNAVALLFPSHVEGFGFPVFEALRAGLPVIATPLPCLAELQGDGIVRCAHDADAWGRAMQQALTAGVEWRTAARAMGEALSQAGWREPAQELAALYRDLARP